jgi:hypothetical protein
MSISPLVFTDQAHLAPPAVLSMHMPTAVLPSIAKAGAGEASTIAAAIAARVVAPRAGNLSAAMCEDISTSL